MKVLILLAMLLASGCASRHATAPTERHPFPAMIDPVTEEVPDVQWH